MTTTMCSTPERSGLGRMSSMGRVCGWLYATVLVSAAPETVAKLRKKSLRFTLIGGGPSGRRKWRALALYAVAGKRRMNTHRMQCKKNPGFHRMEWNPGKQQRLFREVEGVHQVADGGAVGGDVRVVFCDDGVRQVVAAAAGERRKFPVLLNELEDGNVVSVIVRDAPSARIGADDDEGNARAVSEEVQRLDVSGVVITATFVKGDEDGRRGPELRVCLQTLKDVFHKALEQIKLR